MFMSSMSIKGDAAAQSASAFARRAFPTRLLSPARFGQAGSDANGLMIGKTRRSMSISGDLALAVGNCSIPAPPAAPAPPPGLLPPPAPMHRHVVKRFRNAKKKAMKYILTCEYRLQPMITL